MPDLGHRPLMTVHDVIDRLEAWCGSSPDARTHVDIKRAIIDAFRELPTLGPWTYYVRPYRVFLVASYDTGTVEYDHTGGAHERMMTLTDGVWPEWIERGSIRIGQVRYAVDRRISDTVITLDSVLRPNEDIDAGTEYEASQDTYQLPVDFTSSDRGLPEDNWGGMEYVRPADWFTNQRYLLSSGTPRCYTFMGDNKVGGRLVLKSWPPPDADQTLDFIYRSSGRPINTWEYVTGYVTAAGGDNLITLSGGGVFKDAHVGSVIRLASSAAQLPTGIEGLNPYAEERTIVRLNSTTEAVVDDDIDTAYSGVAYRISDPLDVEPTSMFSAFYAGALKYLCVLRNRTDELADIVTNWRFQLNLAKEADMRDGAYDRATLGGPYNRRLRDFPIGPNMES